MRTMLAPEAERERAMPKPIPLREPVIMAVLPLRKVPNIGYLEYDVIYFKMDIKKEIFILK